MKINIIQEDTVEPKNAIKEIENKEVVEVGKVYGVTVFIDKKDIDQVKMVSEYLFVSLLRDQEELTMMEDMGEQLKETYDF